jgi:tryptophanyl-tRNA synthetase
MSKPTNTIVTHEKVESNDKTGLNYQTVVETFGCQLINDELLDKIRKVSNQPKLHSFFENDIFFAHRDLDKLMDNCLKHNSNNFYIYTGRGPSSPNLHLGHMIPFLSAKYLQDVFNVPVIIQITDDEKYYHSKKEGCRIQDFQNYAIENIKDIIACQFNPKKTFIFINSTYTSHMSYNLAKIQKKINLNQIKTVFGYNEEDNMGRVSFPVHQMIPSFASTFPRLLSSSPVLNNENPIDVLFRQLENPKEYQSELGKLKNMRCLIIAAVDQDPYFRILRDVATKIKEHKPAVVYSKFLASLLGKNNKMSASVEKSSIFMTDTPKQIKKKINSFAFSGGQETIEMHKKMGGNPSVDVAFQYIEFFCNDNEKIKDIKKDYISGNLTTGELKKFCIQILTELVETHQQNKSTITNETLQLFLQPHCLLD